MSFTTSLSSLLPLLLHLLLIITNTDSIQSPSSPSPTHSNFLRAAVGGGRHRRMPCAGDPNACLAREKNPWGGTTCCFRRFCRDTMNDREHCGECGRKCAQGLACCGGRCTSLMTDSDHCGSCYYACPSRVGCGFGMCGYGGGDL